MTAWVIKNTKGEVRGISSWGVDYAWRQALNKSPDGVTMYEMKEAFLSLGWKCFEYRLIPKPNESTDSDNLTNEIFNPILYDDYPVVRTSIGFVCKYCGIPHEGLKGDLKNHKLYCRYRLDNEAEVLNNNTEKKLIKKFQTIYEIHDWQKAHQLSSRMIALVLKNCGYEDLSALYLREISKADFEEILENHEKISHTTHQ